MKTWIHVTGDRVKYTYEPGAGKILTRRWRSQDGRSLDVCFHCDQSGKVEGELENEVPYDSDCCDLCGTFVAA